ncbi:MAG: hypothetical protein R2747_11130 [Pyrinomonadaceae bacterium]
MEKEKEIGRLVRVLRQIAFVERFSAVSSKQEELSEFNSGQYNRILARLKEIEPSVANLFIELEEGANPRVIRLAAREVAEYFEEDIEPRRRKRHFGRCGSRGIVVEFKPPVFGGRCR